MKAKNFPVLQPNVLEFSLRPIDAILFAACDGNYFFIRSGSGPMDCST